MPHTHNNPIVVLALGALFLYLGSPRSAFGQAWVPDKGEGSLSIFYQNLTADDHLNFAGKRNRGLGSVRAHSVLTDFEYGITDRLATNIDLTFIASKYQGPVPEGPSDNGLFHSAFQDAHFHLRYNLIKSPLLVTPFIGITVPTHDYLVSGHSAVGRGFHELLVGVNAGRQLGPFLPHIYVHGRYALSIHKRVEGMNTNRSNADLEIGWVATKRLTLRFFGAAQKSHGGFNLPIDLHTEADHEVHDRLARAVFVRLGVGGTFSVKRSFDIHLGYGTTVWGKNLHAAAGMVLGISWRFTRKHDISKMPDTGSPASSIRSSF